jgi:YidC/Oxa1 family membrane protein insertase
MEDQGKRLLLAVAIIAVLFIAWNFLFPPQQPARQAPPTATAPTPEAIEPVPAAAPSGAAAAPTEATEPVDCEVETEGAPTWETEDYVVTFSRCGGTISAFVLKGSQYREKLGGREVQMNLVRTGDDPALYPLQAQVLMRPAGGARADERRIPLIPERATWELVSATADEVAYRWTSADAAMQVVKTFRRLGGKYVFKLDLDVRNVSSRPGDKRVAEPSLTSYGFQDPNVREPSMFQYAEPTWGTACYVDGELKHDTVKDLRAEARARTGDVRWSGLFHQYFLFAAAPLESEQQTCARSVVPSSAGAIKTQLSWSVPATLEPNQGIRRSVVLYAGPKLIDQLQDVSKLVQRETRLEEAVDLGWLAFLSRPMLLLLKVFHGWFGNWGISIILLTVVVKLLTLYWTHKSMRSMKAMSRLKPEMDKLKEKYPNDKQRQNVEMMNLYKAHKISPFGGCLPLLLQMPIWFALYRTLASAAELYRASFAGWIDDLTAPDPYYIIPILLMALMFVQARITPASIDSAQQKIMQWMMPIMMGFFALLFPAGLGVYMVTNTVLGMGHQYYLNKTDVPTKPVVVTASGPAEPPPSNPKGEPRPPRGPKGRKNVAKVRG